MAIQELKICPRCQKEQFCEWICDNEVAGEPLLSQKMTGLTGLTDYASWFSCVGAIWGTLSYLSYPSWLNKRCCFPQESDRFINSFDIK